jgi:hypothetical protein
MQKEAGMKMVRLFVLTLLVFVGVSVAGAQDPLRFRFDITRDGKTVANPELTVAAGGTGHLTFDGIRDWHSRPRCGTRRAFRSSSISIWAAGIFDRS